jgi:hypothetical protein
MDGPPCNERERRGLCISSVVFSGQDECGESVCEWMLLWSFGWWMSGCQVERVHCLLVHSQPYTTAVHLSLNVQ